MIDYLADIMNKVEWTPRLVGELIIASLGVSGFIINWFLRGSRIKKLNRRLHKIEASANTISEDEWRQVQAHLREAPSPTQEKYTEVIQRLAVLEAMYGAKFPTNVPYPITDGTTVHYTDPGKPYRPQSESK